MEIVQESDWQFLRNIFVTDLEKRLDHVSDYNFMYLQDFVKEYLASKGKVEQKIIPFAPDVDTAFDKYAGINVVQKTKVDLLQEVYSLYDKFSEGNYVFSEGAASQLLSPRMSKALGLKPLPLYVDESNNELYYVPQESAEAYMVFAVLINTWFKKINWSKKSIFKNYTTAPSLNYWKDALASE